MVISLASRGLTTGEISAHFAEGVRRVGQQGHHHRRSRGLVLEEMATWWSRPLERVYAALFIDVINVKVRDGQVGPKPFYAAIGVDLDGGKDILAMVPGDGDG